MKYLRNIIRYFQLKKILKKRNLRLSEELRKAEKRIPNLEGIISSRKLRVLSLIDKLKSARQAYLDLQEEHTKTKIDLENERGENKRLKKLYAFEKATHLEVSKGYEDRIASLKKQSNITNSENERLERELGRYRNQNP